MPDDKLPAVWKPTPGMVRLDEARQAIACNKSLTDLKSIRDKAEAIRAYAQVSGMTLEIQNDAAEIKLRAERRAGELLAEMEKHPGGDPRDTRSQPATGSAPRLSDLGVDKSQSFRWQAVAKLPEDKFDAYLTERRDAKEEITTAGAIRLARKDEAATLSRDPVPLPEGRFRVILADPPWRYDNSGFRQSAESKYPTMSAEQIEALPVPAICADDAVLFLWATGPLLPVAFRVVEAWGFGYRNLIVWEKPSGPGIGWWTDGKTEFLLMAGCPKSKPPEERLPSLIRAAKAEHSRKPVEVYELIERVFLKGRVELFSRNPREGWKAWGHEV